MPYQHGLPWASGDSTLSSIFIILGNWRPIWSQTAAVIWTQPMIYGTYYPDSLALQAIVVGFATIRGVKYSCAPVKKDKNIMDTGYEYLWILPSVINMFCCTSNFQPVYFWAFRPVVRGPLISQIYEKECYYPKVRVSGNHNGTSPSVWVFICFL